MLPLELPPSTASLPRPHLWLFCTVEMVTTALCDFWALKGIDRAAQWVLWVIRWGIAEPILKRDSFAIYVSLLFGRIAGVGALLNRVALLLDSRASIAVQLCRKHTYM